MVERVTPSETISSDRKGGGDVKKAEGFMEELDLLGVALRGVNLIEASAGTGKTYAITGLVLRLLLETDVLIQHILVVTFTEAATSELKDRIRTRIREAAEGFSGGAITDPFLKGLLERHREPASRESALRKLQCALSDFDQAAIFTIHGFCFRTLQDHAFASGMLFDAELVTEQDRLVREVVQDFWRRHFYAASPLFYGRARAKGLSPDDLHKLVGRNLFNPHLKVIPEQPLRDCRELEERFLELFEKVGRSWVSNRDAVQAVLLESPALNRQRYRLAAVPGWIREMDLLFQGECLSCSLCKNFEKFTRSHLEGALKKNQAAPAHPFFEDAEALWRAAVELEQAFDTRILGLKAAFVQELRTELERRKAGRNVLFFDDLLVRLERALSEAGGEDLAEAVRGRFKAALIDEFQDTDSIQYAIFRMIFAEGGVPLFLIGDPKQAIYGFRGADIFSYMEASRSTSRRFTLSENWRSEPRLIAGVNAVFQRDEPPPFVYETIGFKPARPAESKNHERFRVDGVETAPLRIRCLDASRLSDGKPIPKGKARPLIVRAVAAEIADLVARGREGKALVGDRPVREGDIAVLVRSNAEAREVWRALSAFSVHGVLYSTANLFDTHEAMEMERVLAAVANPGRDPFIRAALATDLLGWSGEELARLLEDEEGWEDRLLVFANYNEIGSKYGFLRMFRRLLAENEVLSRLMTLPDGERRCTNLLHLSEVLHRTATENGFNLSALHKWLASQRDERAPRLDEHQLRLESDENAVRIVTIHRSKGLEYPIVFCPFVWQPSMTGKVPVLFHDPGDGMRLTLDLGSPQAEENKGLASRELLAENLRLFYVALTRARSLCTFFWGLFNEAGTSAPAYLLHPLVAGGWDGSVRSLEERYRQLDAAAVRTDLEALRDKAPGSIELHEPREGASGVQPPAAAQAVELHSRAFTAALDGVWAVSSFSSLVFNQPHRAELADRDETAVEGALMEAEGGERTGSEQPLDMFSFPRGTASGILLHKVFEEVDFGADDPRALRDTVVENLGEHGFDPVWTDVVCRMVRNVLDIELPSQFGAFRLREVPGSRRLAELQFMFPLRRWGGQELTELFVRHLEAPGGAGELSNRERFRFEAVEGFMKGFIDLVFEVGGRYYIVDWKSNFLGTRKEDYGRDALRKAVRESLYDLQYMLYTVALHRFLESRLPGYRYDLHFGEVFYLFLRGIDPACGPDYGVYRARPSGESIRTLSEALAGPRGGPG